MAMDAKNLAVVLTALMGADNKPARAKVQRSAEVELVGDQLFIGGYDRTNYTVPKAFSVRGERRAYVKALLTQAANLL